MPDSRKGLDSKDVRRFVFYMVVIALCLAALLYMLMNAQPKIAPKIKNTGGGNSSLQVPADLPS